MFLMANEQLQNELEKGKAALAAAEAKIAKLNEEIKNLKGSVLHDPEAHALGDANNRFKELITNLQNGVFLVDENKKIVIVNEMFCRLFGVVVPPEALIGTDGEKVTAQMRPLFKDPEQYRLRVDEILKDKKKVLKDELELVTGQVFTRDFIPIFFQGEYRGHLWKFTDVTRNKTIEATFESQRLFYEQILNNIPADVIVCTAEYRYLYLNPTAVSDTELEKWAIGRSNEEFCKQSNKPAGVAENRRAFFNNVVSSKTENEWEETLDIPGKGVKYFLRKMYPVLDNMGQVAMVIGYGVDITERKKIEEQIKLSEKRYRDIFSYSQAWICTHDMQGQILTINSSARQMLEYDEHEMLGKTIASFIPERVRGQFSNTYMSGITSDGKAEGIMSVQSKSGKKLFLLYQNFLVKEPGIQPYVIGFAQNITERIYMEEALKRSEEKYRGIIENMNLGMIELGVEESIVYANQRFCTMSGFSLNELIGKKATDLFLRGATGKRVSEHISRRAYELTNSYELAVKTKSGEDRWWLISAAPIYNEDGTQKGTIGIHLDITQQKRMEQQLREAKQFTDKAAKSKDIFLTNMSHEIRTPLNAIMGLGKLLSKSMLDVQQKNYLAGIESASENLLGIVNDLLDFSKIEAGKISIESISFNLDSVASGAINILTHKAEEKGRALTYEIEPKVAPVLMGDPYRINQVFMNLLSNAIKFTEKGSISLKASVVAETAEAQSIVVVISDTGVGIKEEYIAQLFDKFTQEDETVVRKFGGTGLGMSITKQLMELMGGTISVKSQKNIGTSISLTFDFKIGTSRVFEKKRTIKNDTSNISGKKVLLVEDNNLNRLLATTILAEYDAIVVEAVNGQEAVDFMRKEHFDIILMDIQMPVMDGIQATQIIRKEINTTIPIIALTANVIKGKIDSFMDAGMDDFIYKPYDEIKLVNPIAKWLNKKVADTPPPVVETPKVELPKPKEAPVVVIETPKPIEVPKSKEAPVVAAAPKPEAPKPVTAPTVVEIPKVAEVPKPQPAKAVVISDPDPLDIVYDLTKLKNIGRNDPVFITKMVKLFVDEIPDAVSKICEAYENNDINTITYLAHRIKPSILNMGINSIKTEILKVEAARDHPLNETELGQLIGKLDQTISTAVAQLKVEYHL